MKINIETLLVVLAGGVGLFFGDDVAVLNVVNALFIVILFDIVTGVVKANYMKGITSEKWIDGFIRKILMLMCVSFCYFLDKFAVLNLGVSLEVGAAMFFTAGEVISVFENFVEMGLKMPPVLVNYLAKYHEEDADGK
jgi:toxin secretion/phage lysis holin